MMRSNITENQISFKEFEQKIFQFACIMAQKITKDILEEYDKELMKKRDKKQYRHKGKRKSVIKTIYGEVEYSRVLYQTKLEDGKHTSIFLLDKALDMNIYGHLSTNLVEKIVDLVAEAPYRVTAEQISQTTGQTISHGGVCNLVQQVGETIIQEENQMVREMEQEKGTKEIPILFEEMDGVWLFMQGKDHKKEKKQEIKVATTYEGWDGTSKNRSRLVGKKVIAGLEKSKEFHKKREVQIAKQYNRDEIERRVLNGDRGSWSRDPYDSDTIIQLDPFHVYQAMRRSIKNNRALSEIKCRYEAGRIDELLEYIKIYVDSVESGKKEDKQSQEARKLYDYLYRNKENLCRIKKEESTYQSQKKESCIDKWEYKKLRIVRLLRCE